MTTEGRPSLQVEIDPDHVNEEQDCQHLEPHKDVTGTDHEPEISPSKTLIQSVSEILVQSAQSVKALASGSALPISNDVALLLAEIGEEKSVIQSMGVIISQSVVGLKEVVIGNIHGSRSDNGEEKTLLQAVGARIAESAQSVKDNVSGTTDNVTTPIEETAEASILIHTILD